jgi:hypothetical protein
LDLSGNVAYWGQDLLISSTSLSVTQDYQIPSLSPLVFDVEGAAAIDQLVIDLAGCENGYIKSAALKLNLVQAWIFGSAVGPTKINVNTSELVKIIAAKGDSIDANVRLQGLSYEVEAELSPPPALHSAMSLLLNARRSQNSVWVFNQQGNIPC